MSMDFQMKILKTFDFLWRASCYDGVRHIVKFGPESQLASLQFFLDMIEEDFQDELLSREIYRNIIYSVFNNGRDGYEKTLAYCASFELNEYRQCIRGIITGVFRSRDYERGHGIAQLLCSEPTIFERGAREFCYQEIIKRIYDTYSQSAAI